MFVLSLPVDRLGMLNNCVGRLKILKQANADKFTHNWMKDKNGSIYLGDLRERL